MRRLARTGKGLFVGVVGAAICIGASAYTSVAEAVFRPCPWSDLQCLDVWDPVICPNGQIYSNACYARRACQTGCVPY